MSEQSEIYVALLDEGTVVWRPVWAEKIGTGLYRLQGSVPETEHWQFQPGDMVRCREHQFSGGTWGLIAVAKVSG